MKRYIQRFKDSTENVEETGFSIMYRTEISLTESGPIFSQSPVVLDKKFILFDHKVLGVDIEENEDSKGIIIVNRIYDFYVRKEYIGHDKCIYY